MVDLDTDMEKMSDDEETPNISETLQTTKLAETNDGNEEEMSQTSQSEIWNYLTFGTVGKELMDLGKKKQSLLPKPLQKNPTNVDAFVRGLATYCAQYHPKYWTHLLVDGKGAFEVEKDDFPPGFKFRSKRAPDAFPADVNWEKVREYASLNGFMYNKANSRDMAKPFGNYFHRLNGQIGKDLSKGDFAFGRIVSSFIVKIFDCIKGCEFPDAHLRRKLIPAEILHAYGEHKRLNPGGKWSKKLACPQNLSKMFMGCLLETNPDFEVLNRDYLTDEDGEFEVDEINLEKALPIIEKGKNAESTAELIQNTEEELRRTRKLISQYEEILKTTRSKEEALKQELEGLKCREKKEEAIGTLSKYIEKEAEGDVDAFIKLSAAAPALFQTVIALFKTQPRSGDLEQFVKNGIIVTLAPPTITDVEASTSTETFGPQIQNDASVEHLSDNHADKNKEANIPEQVENVPEPNTSSAKTKINIQQEARDQGKISFKAADTKSKKRINPIGQETTSNVFFPAKKDRVDYNKAPPAKALKLMDKLRSETDKLVPKKSKPKVLDSMLNEIAEDDAELFDQHD